MDAKERRKNNLIMFLFWFVGLSIVALVAEYLG